MALINFKTVALGVTVLLFLLAFAPFILCYFVVSRVCDCVQHFKPGQHEKEEGLMKFVLPILKKQSVKN